MPYIPQNKRGELQDIINSFKKVLTQKRKESTWISVGEMNYLISSLCKEYVENRGLGYPEINNLVGVLECVKLELYRQVAVPYENRKLKENGKVYE